MILFLFLFFVSVFLALPLIAELSGLADGQSVGRSVELRNCFVGRQSGSLFIRLPSYMNAYLPTCLNG